jgi:hypothetical protein
MISQTIIALVQLRKQVIEDIYQIMGISDIMRGSTDPGETLGAQQLKTQNGSTRIRDKQQELVRLSRDLVEISLEIICQTFDPVTIIEMSQTQLPTEDMQRRATQELIGQIQEIYGQMQQLQSQPPQLPPPGGTSDGAPPASSPTPGQGNPQAQQLQQMQTQIQDLMGQLQKVKTKPTIEQVLHFLSDNRARAFTLDIETDSTILADEMAEKQARTEFTGVLGGLLPQLSQMITAEPKTAEFCGELLKFATAPFRAGRSLDGAIDDLIEQMKAKGEQPRGEDPATQQAKLALQIEGLKQQTAREKLAQDAKFHEAELAQKDRHKTWELNNQKEIERLKLVQTQQSDAAKAQVQNQKLIESRETHQMHVIEKQQDMKLNNQKFQLQAGQAKLKNADMAQRANERSMAHQQKMQQPTAGGPI